MGFVSRCISYTQKMCIVMIVDTRFNDSTF